MSLLVCAGSASEVRVDQAATAVRRTPRGNAARSSSAGGALAEDRLRLTNGFLRFRQSSAKDGAIVL
jgi:hypothetical protein